MCIRERVTPLIDEELDFLNNKYCGFPKNGLLTFYTFIPGDVS